MREKKLTQTCLMEKGGNGENNASGLMRIQDCIYRFPDREIEGERERNDIFLIFCFTN